MRDRLVRFGGGYRIIGAGVTESGTFTKSDVEATEGRGFRCFGYGAVVFSAIPCESGGCRSDIRELLSANVETGKTD
jgi:hypothetical protein